ncbi:hypothetical protein B0H67DRAFT_647747 [Lasiosphaeris hirsuta]|uniref:Voltage-gated hydrogen channel 1 n=1 Tax=Lasiosphaeris hirsuta TaxID=260670 RepID=A0AA40A1Y2_9PEZI|nr:hypothetical protein B0H67DRAFT_647747 [Lasiosphaeris hirsuta]
MADNEDDALIQPLIGQRAESPESPFYSMYAHRRRQARALLSSNGKHYVVMALVALDVMAILTDIFIALAACDFDLEGEEWVPQVRQGLHIFSLVFSAVFLAELLFTVWAFGQQFFQDWFHCFDAIIIVASFIIDVVTRGIVEQIGSIVIVLRLWRFVKIVEELSLGASERIEETESKVDDLERENADLKTQIEVMRNERWEARGESQ